jgi:hypothetical protein
MDEPRATRGDDYRGAADAGVGLEPLRQQNRRYMLPKRAGMRGRLLRRRHKTAMRTASAAGQGAGRERQRQQDQRASASLKAWDIERTSQKSASLKPGGSSARRRTAWTALAVNAHFAVRARRCLSVDSSGCRRVALR